MFKRNRLSVFLILVLLLCFLAACGQEQPVAITDSTTDTTTIDSTESNTTTVADTTEDENVLRIVTDKSEKFTTNDLLNSLIKDFSESHPEVTVKLEILPEDLEERAIRLESIRAEIMSGDGPDVFLFPTANIGNRWKGLLFPDVAQSMHNGIFADISTFYDVDDELNKDQLHSTIMEAGVLNGERYVLPLWYSIGAILIDSEKLAQYDISEEEIAGNAKDLYNVILEKNDPYLAAVTDLSSIGPKQYFPQLLNYETDQVHVTSESIAEFLKLNYRHETLIYEGQDPDTVGDLPENSGASIGAYVSRGYFWRNGSRPIFFDSLSYALRSYVISQAGGYGALKAIPVRSADGSITAEVSYWGAVSAGCDNVELAYEFLRLLLSEKAQWEIGRSTSGIAFSGSFYTSGYPVRTQGSVEHLITSVITMGSKSIELENPEESEARLNALEQVTLTDDDFPLLDVEIDNVRFPILWEPELTFQRNASIEFDPFSVPSDEEIDKWAKELYRELEFHIAEG